MSDIPFIRLGHKPLITVDSLPLKANAVLNPGVVDLNGEVILLLRIEDSRGISQIRAARSHNGLDTWRFDETPLLEPDLPENPFEEWGCDDARVTRVDSDQWLIAYTAFSRYGPAVSLATTSDFRSVTRLGVVMPPTNKDAAVFPEQFDGRWIMLHRPVTAGYEHIWHVTAENSFINWTSPGILLPERGGPWWDGLRIGVGAPPIRTDDGWLLIYHGVKETMGNPVYRLGVALLELENPRKAIARSYDWVFAPEADYEQRGLAPNVVYTCGAIARGDELWMYYGAADTAIGLAVAKTANLVRFTYEHDYLAQVGRGKGMAR